MIIEKGKFYLNDIREVVKITTYDEGYSYPYRDQNGKQYDMRGNMPGYHGHKLVEEIDEKDIIHDIAMYDIRKHKSNGY